MEGFLDKGATIGARKRMQAEVEEAAFRALLHQNRHSMEEVGRRAIRSPGGRQVAGLLRRCGPISGKCPFCVHLQPEGTVLEDSAHHARFECQNHAMKAARCCADAVLAERLTREGRCFPFEGQVPTGAVGALVGPHEVKIKQLQQVRIGEAEGTAILMPDEQEEMTVSQARVLILAETVLKNIANTTKFAATAVKLLRHNLQLRQSLKEEFKTEAATGETEDPVEATTAAGQLHET